LGEQANDCETRWNSENIFRRSDDYTRRKFIAITRGDLALRLKERRKFFFAGKESAEVVVLMSVGKPRTLQEVKGKD
jgi:hypothetical protein